MNKKLIFLIAICLALVVACVTDTAPIDPTSTPSSALRSTPAENEPEPEADQSEQQNEQSDQTETGLTGTKRVLVLYTNDEHGWMEGVDENLGAANLVGTWQENHDLDSYDAVIKLSGGDMWTGPAISTWFSGESMVEVLNTLDYTAAAVGNHEFDFGLEQLMKNEMSSTFPFVSANIRYKENGATPADIGILPYVIKETGGLRIGITGLTTTSTPVTTNPANVTDFEFLGYAEALNEVVPQIEAEGVDLILVPGHVCLFELRLLAPRIRDLGVDLLGGGHCNELYSDSLSGIPTLIGGSHLAAYGWAELAVSADGVELVDIGNEWTNSRAAADPAVAEVVARWQNETDGALNVQIGQLDQPLARRGLEQQALITESWLYWFPTADVALTNLGGFRADLPAGEVTQGTIINVFPFNNVIVEVDMTGQQLLRILGRRSGDLAIGGVEQSGGRWRFKHSGDELDSSETYTVLVNDFMWAGGDGYDELVEYDPNGYNTAVDWRQPVIDWINDTDGSQSLDARIQDLIQNGSRK